MLEQTLFDLLVHAAWNLRRIRTLEARMIGEGIDPFVDEENSPAAHRLERYRQRYERSFYKALNELRAVQTARMEQQEELTKQTPDQDAITEEEDLRRLERALTPPLRRLPPRLWGRPSRFVVCHR